jgi:hypothetical protein
MTMAERPTNSLLQSATASAVRLSAPGMTRASAAKSSSVRTSMREGLFGVPINLASFSGVMVVKDDMDASLQKQRDAILEHVASWEIAGSPWPHYGELSRACQCACSARTADITVIGRV